MTPDEMRELHERHVEAENRLDVEATLATFGDDPFIHNQATGAFFEGRDAIAAQYRALFEAFPDGRQNVEGRAYGDDVLVSWGTYTGTMTGPFLGMAATGRRVEFPIVNIVPFRDGRIHGERVLFNLADVAAQAGLAAE